MENMKSCRCAHHSMTGVFVVLLALAFFLDNAGIIDGHTVSLIWPVLLGLLGLQKIFSRRCKCCPTGDKSGCCSPKSEPGQCGTKY